MFSWVDWHDRPQWLWYFNYFCMFSSTRDSPWTKVNTESLFIQTTGAFRVPLPFLDSKKNKNQFFKLKKNCFNFQVAKKRSKVCEFFENVQWFSVVFNFRIKFSSFFQMVFKWKPFINCRFNQWKISSMMDQIWWSRFDGADFQRDIFGGKKFDHRIW